MLIRRYHGARHKLWPGPDARNAFRASSYVSASLILIWTNIRADRHRRVNGIGQLCCRSSALWNSHRRHKRSHDFVILEFGPEYGLTKTVQFRAGITGGYRASLGQQTMAWQQPKFGLQYLCRPQAMGSSTSRAAFRTASK